MVCESADAAWACLNTYTWEGGERLIATLGRIVSRNGPPEKAMDTSQLAHAGPLFSYIVTNPDFPDLRAHYHPQFGLWRVTRAHGGDDILPRGWPPDLTPATRRARRAPPKPWAAEVLNGKESDIDAEADNGRSNTQLCPRYMSKAPSACFLHRCHHRPPHTI